VRGIGLCGRCGEAMAAITLESDSSQSPPVSIKGNERSSKRSPKTNREVAGAWQSAARILSESGE
jgi:hypothetical protein